MFLTVSEAVAQPRWQATLSQTGKMDVVNIRSCEIDITAAALSCARAIG